MGEISAPRPSLLLMAVTSRHDAALQWAERMIGAAYGDLLPASPIFEFSQTDYYAESMGEDLQKQFFVCASPFDPGQLAEVKRTTNAWEDEYRSTATHDELRPLNIDPGYLTLAKLILASTKDHSHRIYLRHGIYAETTLQFRQKRWQEMPWTYPDYCQPAYHEYFSACRERLRQLAT